MSVFKILLLSSFVISCVFGGVAYALATPSDYAQDAKKGTLQLKSDKAARLQADQIKISQEVDAKVHAIPVPVSVTMSEQESHAHPVKKEKSGNQKDQASPSSQVDKHKSDTAPSNSHAPVKDKNNGKSE